MTTFDSLGLSAPLLEGVHQAGYDAPTPIQAAAIPVAVTGRDLIGCAQTGTGKTASFVLPVLQRLLEKPFTSKTRPVRALVVTPTRELALQVEQAVQTYGARTSLRSLAVFGGTSMNNQIRALRPGADLLVATPGRLLDHLNRGTVDLSRVEVLVLDEADRMLDMGFINDIRKIVATLPDKRQTLLFSATLSKDIQKLASSLMDADAAFVEVGERRNPAATVTQHACPVAPEQKMDLLFHVLEQEPIEHVLVFSRTKYRADRITRKLSQKGFAVAALHSNKSQNQREKALDGFREGRYRILVATDIAARGIDVDSISHVINFDTPNQPEDYIHRIGRTGRAQTSGDALTFVARDEEAYLHNIEKHTGQRLARKIYEAFAAPAPADVPARQQAASESRPQPAGSSKRRNRNRRRSSAGRSATR